MLRYHIAFEKEKSKGSNEEERNHEIETLATAPPQPMIDSAPNPSDLNPFKAGQFTVREELTANDEMAGEEKFTIALKGRKGKKEKESSKIKKLSAENQAAEGEAIANQAGLTKTQTRKKVMGLQRLIIQYQSP